MDFWRLKQNESALEKKNIYRFATIGDEWWRRVGGMLRSHGLKFIELRKSPSKYRTECAHHLHCKENFWLRAIAKLPPSTVCACALVFQSEIESQFSSCCDWSIECEWIYYFIVRCVCVCKYEFVYIFHHKMLCENQMECVVILKLSTWQKLVHTTLQHARMRPIDFSLIQLWCCLATIECALWIGEEIGHERQRCNFRSEKKTIHCLICNAQPIVLGILLRIFAILINWCDMSQSHIDICHIFAACNNKEGARDRSGLNSPAMNYNKRLGRKTSMFL